MKRIYILFVAFFATVSMFAATEQAWYNDVPSITNGGQYYIYSVNGKGFMQGGNSKVKSVNQNNYNTESGLLFTINQTNNRTYSGSNYLCSYETKTCGPVGGTNTDGSTMIWEGKSGYWLVYGSYTFIWAQKAYLRYENSEYKATCLNPDLDDAKFHWYVVSPAQYDRHWAIYNYDRRVEQTADYTKYEGLVPAAYYDAMTKARGYTFNVKNAEHSKAAVQAVHVELNNLYNNADDVAAAYAAAKAAINAVEEVEDKGEDFTEVTAGIAAAKEAIEKAMTVEALQTATSAPALKAIDPVTFNVLEFTALEALGSPAATVSGRSITYAAADKSIINAEGMPVYKGETTLTATAAATDDYYTFVRSAKVTVNPIHNTGAEEHVICAGEKVDYQQQTFTESIVKNFTLVNRTGGDSVVTLTVIVNQPSVSEENMSVVYGEQKTWNGYDLSVYTVGHHEETFTTVNAVGCDSVVTLNLTVNKMDVFEVQADLQFCAGDSVEYRDRWYKLADEYKLNAVGEVRDTLITVNVAVLDKNNTELFDTITAGESVTWHETAYVLGQAGDTVFVDSLLNVNNCDSVVYYKVHVNEAEPVHTALDNSAVQSNAQKFFRNGQFLIIRKEKTYTVQGQEVK